MDISHDLLGYGALTIGILMIFSTDQFLLFLFGPVESGESESGSIGESITQFWNRFISADGSKTESSDSRKASVAKSPIFQIGFFLHLDCCISNRVDGRFPVR